MAAGISALIFAERCAEETSVTTRAKRAKGPLQRETLSLCGSVLADIVSVDAGWSWPATQIISHWRGPIIEVIESKLLSWKLWEALASAHHKDTVRASSARDRIR